MEKSTSYKYRPPKWALVLIALLILWVVLRVFVLGLYRVPSGSMLPTAQTNAYIVVNKMAYGTASPERGDLVVLNSPVEKRMLFQRLIALPGDTVVYQDKQLTINGEAVVQTRLEDYVNQELGQPISEPQYEETLGGRTYRVLRHRYNPMSDDIGPGTAYFSGLPSQLENCTYHEADFTCHIPDGHYFMMGDNRDNALDSRFWGFVPEENLIGKVFYIWQ